MMNGAGTGKALRGAAAFPTEPGTYFASELIRCGQCTHLQELRGAWGETMTLPGHGESLAQASMAPSVKQVCAATCEMVKSNRLCERKLFILR